MPSQKVTSLGALGSSLAEGDQFYVVDVSDTTDSPQGTSKKVGFTDLIAYILNRASDWFGIQRFRTGTLQIESNGVAGKFSKILMAGPSAADRNFQINLPDTDISVSFGPGTTLVSGANTGDEVAASDTVQGKIEIATAAEIETGTDVVRAVTPGRQHNHKSAAKAWVIFTISGTTVTVRDSYGLAAVNPVVRNGVGDYTINFLTAFSSAYYVGLLGATNNTAGTSLLWGVASNANPPTTTAFRAAYLTSGGSFGEAARVEMAFYGDQ